MVTHTAHPASLEVGLADNCPRCKEHAENPFAQLDDEHLADITMRLLAATEPRSDNEALAYVRISRVMTQYRHLKRVLKRVKDYDLP